MKISLCGVLILLIWLTSGCVNIDYIGQSLPQSESGQPVIFYRNRLEMPLNKYQIIGRAKVSAPAKIGQYELREKILNCAATHGADAVCVVNNKVVDLGFYPQDDNSSFAPETGQKRSPVTISVSSNNNWENSDEVKWSPKTAKRLGSAQRRREVHLQVLFLANSQRLSTQKNSGKSDNE